MTADQQRRGLPVVALGALALVLVACAASPGQEGSASPVPTLVASAEATAAPLSTDRKESDVPDELLAAILADAAQRAGVSTEEIEVTAANAVTFTDGSLDCPEPGMMYTQALVDGYRIVVEVAEEELDYRVGSGGSFRLCEGGGTGTGSKNES